MTKPAVSIIIPTWNTRAITQKCVDTIFRFLPPEYFELIIVDNGSTDDTQEFFSLQKKFKYIRNSENLGFSKGNNIGAKHATAPYLFFLNSDMELIDSHLVDMVKFLQTSPKIGIVGPMFLNPDLTPQGSVFPNQSVFNAFQEFWLKIPAFSKYIPTEENPVSVWAISGGALLISTTLFRQIKGWDERYFMFFEDLEICRQIRHLHFEIYYYPNFKVIHRHGASGAKVADSSNQWRRLIPSSIKYHGYLGHYILNFVIWTSQKFHRLTAKIS